MTLEPAFLCYLARYLSMDQSEAVFYGSSTLLIVKCKPSRIHLRSGAYLFILLKGTEEMLAMACRLTYS